MDVCLLLVLCCQIEVRTGWYLVQRSPTESVCVTEWSWSLSNGGPGPLGAVAPWKKINWRRE
jgi:hypothetical protein